MLVFQSGAERMASVDAVWRRHARSDAESDRVTHSGHGTIGAQIVGLCERLPNRCLLLAVDYANVMGFERRSNCGSRSARVRAGVDARATCRWLGDALIVGLATVSWPANFHWNGPLQR